ncbi:MAG: DNA replication/repair protein RecF [Acidiferrobacterales bacterium]
MALTLLEVHNLRILEQVTLAPSIGLNVICGPNGSGKTSLLEAIHILGRGRSFRSSSVSQLLRRGAAGPLTVHGRGSTEGGDEILLGVERTQGARRIKVNGEASESASTLAQALPLQLVMPDTRHLFTHNAKHRRGVLDWGLFHVEPHFYPLWSRYQRILRQRNAALREGVATGALASWDQALATVGEQLHALRQRHQMPWNERIAYYVGLLLDEAHVHVQLRPGWPSEKCLAAALADDRSRDYAAGFTHAGIQRADLEVYVDQLPLRETASHGQQKLVVISLLLAHVELFMRESGRRCLLLLDDLPGELDAQRCARLLSVMARLGVQTFATAMEPQAIDTTGWRAHTVFHVEHGRLDPGHNV